MGRSLPTLSRRSPAVAAQPMPRQRSASSKEAAAAARRLGTTRSRNAAAVHRAGNHNAAPESSRNKSTETATSFTALAARPPMMLLQSEPAMQRFHVREKRPRAGCSGPSIAPVQGSAGHRCGTCFESHWRGRAGIYGYSRDGGPGAWASICDRGTCMVPGCTRYPRSACAMICRSKLSRAPGAAKKKIRSPANTPEAWCARRECAARASLHLSPLPQQVVVDTGQLDCGGVPGHVPIYTLRCAIQVI